MSLKRQYTNTLKCYRVKRTDYSQCRQETMAHGFYKFGDANMQSAIMNSHADC